MTVVHAVILTWNQYPWSLVSFKTQKDYLCWVYETKEKITQSSEYQRFCWEVTKLKQLTDKMQRREIESVCEEIAEIAPTYVLI